jgi:hypothetical protein
VALAALKWRRDAGDPRTRARASAQGLAYLSHPRGRGWRSSGRNEGAREGGGTRGRCERGEYRRVGRAGEAGARHFERNRGGL